MNIKKGILFAAIFFSAGSLFAQAGKVKSALTNFQKYYEFKQAGNAKLGETFIKSAKEAIDAAIVHDKTKESAEAWAYYGTIYANIGADANNAEDIAKAKEALAKARQLDKDNKFTENITLGEQTIYVYNFNQGVAAWDKQDYNAAYNAFHEASLIVPGDTTTTYYAGIAALQSNDYQKGLEKYLALVDRKDYSEHKKILKDLPNIYLTLQDTTNALKYVGIAAKEYPEDSEIANQNINFNIALGNTAGIMNDLKAQIEKEPTNKTLYFYLGIAEASQNNEQAALEAYKKALEIDPDYTDANVNAGVVIMNLVREDLQKLNSDRNITNAAYNAKVAEFKERAKGAEKYFLNAIKVNPNEESALRGLKSLYDFLQEEEKSKEIQAKLDALN